MTVLIRVNISCPHCFNVFLPALVSSADFDFELITDIDPRIFTLPVGGATPVFIGVYDNGDIAYFENFAPGNPLLVYEAYLQLKKLTRTEAENKTATIPFDHAWILSLWQ